MLTVLHFSYLFSNINKEHVPGSESCLDTEDKVFLIVMH